MQAVVYYGKNDVRLETVPVPEIGPGELLVRVHTCGICGTDLKKIATGSHSAPRIFGHETAGQVVAVGEGVKEFKVGDRVVVFHHIPCGHCYYCRHKVFAQCEVYKKVGATAGFIPSGGGFSEYVRVMDWIVRTGGVVRIPKGVSYEQASFIEEGCSFHGASPRGYRAGDGAGSDRDSSGDPGSAKRCIGDYFRFVPPEAYNIAEFRADM
jgi:L-iditol 2-dehydrogenase